MLSKAFRDVDLCFLLYGIRSPGVAEESVDINCNRFLKCFVDDSPDELKGLDNLKICPANERLDEQKFREMALNPTWPHGASPDISEQAHGELDI